MQNPTSSHEMDQLYHYLAGNDVVYGNFMNHHHTQNYGGFGFGNNYNNNNNNSNYSSSGSTSFCAGSSGIIMNETPESKAIAASRILHKEAEKRRRERINSHLDRLRSLLPCTSKTDKATLLSKVVQRVLELKRQTSELLELENLTIPSENDEFGVYIHHDDNNNNESLIYEDDNDVIDEDGNSNSSNNNSKVILKASLCCEDRPDLFSDLNQVLNSLNLKTLRAEISTLGGRIQGIIIVSPNNNNKCPPSDECAVFLRDALKGIVQRSSGPDERLKRRRRVFDPSC